jgi:hypothetical protein
MTEFVLLFDTPASSFDVIAAASGAGEVDELGENGVVVQGWRVRLDFPEVEDVENTQLRFGLRPTLRARLRPEGDLAEDRHLGAVVAAIAQAVAGDFLLVFGGENVVAKRLRGIVATSGRAQWSALRDGLEAWQRARR